MSGEDAGFADSQEVNKVTLRDGEEDRAESDVGALRDPETLVDYARAQDAKDNEIFAYVGEGRAAVGCVVHIHSRRGELIIGRGLARRLDCV
jgi:hypothetical protein